jgi:GntR family transcriptional regulator / MocR family aminotransferase
MLIQLAGSEPLYQQIYDALKHKVLSGELQRGTKMPSSRTLADNLCVSRNIVLIAYEQLVAEGSRVAARLRNVCRNHSR